MLYSNSNIFKLCSLDVCYFLVFIYNSLYYAILLIWIVIFWLLITEDFEIWDECLWLYLSFRIVTILLLGNISSPHLLFIWSYWSIINIFVSDTGIKLTTNSRKCFQNATSSCIISLSTMARMAKVIRALHWFFLFYHRLKWGWIQLFVRYMECSQFLINTSYLRKLRHSWSAHIVLWCFWTTFDLFNDTLLIWPALSYDNVNLMVLQGCCCSISLLNWVSSRSRGPVRYNPRLLFKVFRCSIWNVRSLHEASVIMRQIRHNASIAMKESMSILI